MQNGKDNPITALDLPMKDLTGTVDMTGRDHHLTVEFNDRTNTHVHDTTRLNLKTGKMLRS